MPDRQPASDDAEDQDFSSARLMELQDKYLNSTGRFAYSPVGLQCLS
jgi:hypothetical protein